MICKNCNSEIPDNLVSCPKCGSNTNVDIQLFCKHCGATLNKDDEFCTSCGKYTEKKKDEIETNNAVAGSMVALGFVVPIIGFIYAATNSKSNPATAKATLVASIIGFIIEASVFLPSMLYFLY